MSENIVTSRNHQSVAEVPCLKPDNGAHGEGDAETWECERCTYYNVIGSTQCEICGHIDRMDRSVKTVASIAPASTLTTSASSAKMNETSTEKIWADPFADGSSNFPSVNSTTSLCTSVSSDASTSSSLSSTVTAVCNATVTSSWTCTFCFYESLDLTLRVCPICQTAREAIASVADSVPSPEIAAAPAALPSKKTISPIESKWTCNYCLFSGNKPSSFVCEIDGKPKGWLPTDSEAVGVSAATPTNQIEIDVDKFLALAPGAPSATSSIPSSASMWTCGWCHFKFNSESQYRCEACGKSKYLETSSTTSIGSSRVVSNATVSAVIVETIAPPASGAAPAIPSKVSATPPTSQVSPPVLRPKETSTISGPSQVAPAIPPAPLAQQRVPAILPNTEPISATSGSCHVDPPTLRPKEIRQNGPQVTIFIFPFVECF